MARNTIANSAQIERAIDNLKLLDYRTIEQMNDVDIYSYLSGGIRNHMPKLSAADKRALTTTTAIIKSGGDEAVKLLIEHSKKRTPISSLYALSLLHEMGNEAALPYFIDCVGNKVGFEFNKEATLALLDHGKNAIPFIVERVNSLVESPDKYTTKEYRAYSFYINVLLKILYELEYDKFYELITHISNNVTSLDVQSVLCNILGEIQDAKSIDLVCDIRNRYGYYIEIDEHTRNLIADFNSKMEEEDKRDCIIENLDFPSDVREIFNTLLKMQSIIHEDVGVNLQHTFDELLNNLPHIEDLESYIIQLAKVDYESVACLACTILGFSKTPASRATLIEIIKNDDFRSQAIVACAALAKMGEYALQEIISQIDDSIMLKKSGDLTTDGHIDLMPALSMMDNEVAFNYLISLLDILDDNDLSTLIRNLEATQNSASIPHLEKLILRLEGTDNAAIIAQVHETLSLIHI